MLKLEYWLDSEHGLLHFVLNLQQIKRKAATGRSSTIERTKALPPEGKHRRDAHSV